MTSAPPESTFGQPAAAVLTLYFPKTAQNAHVDRSADIAFIENEQNLISLHHSSSVATTVETDSESVNLCSSSLVRGTVPGLLFRTALLFSREQPAREAHSSSEAGEKISRTRQLKTALFLVLHPVVHHGTREREVLTARISRSSVRLSEELHQRQVVSICKLCSLLSQPCRATTQQRCRRRSKRFQKVGKVRPLSFLPLIRMIRCQSDMFPRENLQRIPDARALLYLIS